MEPWFISCHMSTTKSMPNFVSPCLSFWFCSLRLLSQTYPNSGVIFYHSLLSNGDTFNNHFYNSPSSFITIELTIELYLRLPKNQVPSQVVSSSGSESELHHFNFKNYKCYKSHPGVKWWRHVLLSSYTDSKILTICTKNHISLCYIHIFPSPIPITCMKWWSYASYNVINGQKKHTEFLNSIFYHNDFLIYSPFPQSCRQSRGEW